MFISFIQKIAQPMFGTFEPEEFKKFVRMGFTLSCVLGAYWVLLVLKNALFCQLVGPAFVPFAKTFSVLCLVPFLMIYSKLLDTYSREKTFYIISSCYMFGAFIFALLFLHPSIGEASQAILCARVGAAKYVTQILAFVWFVFAESYGSLIVALFWAIAADTTLPKAAKKGYSLVVALSQLGGIITPFLIGGLPQRLGLQGNSLSIFLSGAVIFLSMLMMRNFFKNTPKNLLVSYKGEQTKKEQTLKIRPGFFQGLKLLVTHKYLLGIFCVVSFPEILMTIFSMHFQLLAAQHYQGVALSSYLGVYGSWVNITSLCCLLLGIGNIARLLGVGAALLVMPMIYAGALSGFSLFNSLNFLFILLVGAKAINYALNNPAIKQLYIPTTHDTRFKAQAWIETFGSRSSKQFGSLFNMLIPRLQARMGQLAGVAQHVVYSSYLGIAVISLWFLVAFYLGKTHKKAIEDDQLVC